MLWLLHDLDLLAVLLRAAALSFEALLIGGVVFLLVVARRVGASADVAQGCRRGIRWAAVAMAGVQAASVAVACSLLMGSSDLKPTDLVTADFVLAGAAVVVCAALLWLCASPLIAERRAGVLAMPLLCLALLTGAVWTSHAMSRMEHRGWLALLTAAHHLGTAAWIGAMPFLLVALRRAETVEEARRMAARYSAMALASVSVLVLAGVGLAWVYVGDWSGVYGTAYGVLLLAKIYLLLVMLAMGGGNWLLVRRLEMAPAPLLARLRRFAEAEIGLGFTAVLVAASLTAQAPAVDQVQDRLTGKEIIARMRPELPRLRSPSLAQLTPATPMIESVRANEFGNMSRSDALDRAWSEYNHHWAGLIVLLAGGLALLSRMAGSGWAWRWARYWPVSFAGLALFILLRADPETWPLGPRGFWESFAAPDVLEHRAAALLALLFAAFECAVQAGRVKMRWAAYVFPAMCALGAALLLTHSHATGDMKEEVLAQLAHTPVALLGATAGWSRWLELRLPPSRAARAASAVWPACLMMAGLVLLNYRE